MKDNENYVTLAETVRGMVEEYGYVDHFIMNPIDAEEAEFDLEMDDLTGENYVDVEGYRVYLNDQCPLGQVGACAPDKGIGQA